MTVVLTSLVSCKLFNKNKDNGDGSEEGSSHTIFSPELSINLVKGTGAKDLNEAANRVFDLTGRIAGVIPGSSIKEGNEIIFGKADREICDIAQAKLDVLVRRGTIQFEDEGRNVDRLGVFVIYAEGGSVVMMWNNNNIAESAVEFFMENYMNNTTLILEDGYTYHETFDFIEFMEKAEATKRQGYLDAIAKQYDDEVAKAVDDLWSIYDDRYVLWLADLYDPGEYDEDGNPIGGGFYYSNSARDNDGYGVDLESTAQILFFLTSSGMLPNMSYSLSTYIPEKMQKEMVAFALSCQSPVDGFFYHPQWGTSISESRKSRDHGWALDILNAFNAKPYFNSVLGAKGIYGDAPGYDVDVKEYIEGLNSPTALTGRLGSSSVSAVSKVVATSDDVWTGSAMFKDLDAWIKYLEALESTIRTKSYSIGNTISGLAGQAKSREKMALENGELVDADGNGYADGGYREMFQYYFNKWMLPENGVWEYGTVEDGTVTYASINGLMKTIGAYNGFGFKHPYAEKAVESALFIATLEGPDVKGDTASASVDVFNPFVAIQLTLNNMKNYGSVEEANALNDMIKERAAEIINVTRLKIIEFQKDDGSFGYTKTTSPSASQGAPVSVPYTVEGDVNGGGIATNGTTRYIRELFDFEMPLFYRSDFYKFIERASGNSAVLKGAAELRPASIITFDDDTDSPSSVIDNMRDGELSVIEDPRTGATGNVMKFVTYPGGGSSFSVNPGEASAANSLVLEWEMCFDEVKYINGTLFQIKIGSSYMFTCGVNSKGQMTLGDSSSVSSPLTSGFSVVEANPYIWNKIRLEYYVVDPEAGETLTKFYFNDQLRGVSTNYMGKETAGKMPKMSYTGATFSALAATNMTVLFDNIYATQSETKYEDEMIYNPDRVKDFEDAEIGTQMPANVTSEKGEIVLAPTEDNAENKALLLAGNGENAAIKVTTASADVNTYAVSTDIKIDATAAGAAAKLYMVDYVSKSRAIAAYEIETYMDGILKARITELDLEGNKGESFEGIPVGEWFNLRIEFYLYRYLAGDCSKIYVNNDLIGIGSLWGGIDTISRTYKYFYIVNSLDTTSIYLDNVIPERVDIAFTDAEGNVIDDPDIEIPKGGESSKVAADEYHNGKFDFEDQELGTPSVAGLQTKVNGAEYGNNMDVVTDPKDAANKVLWYRVMKASNGLANSMVVTASKNSPAGANCHVLEFDMLVTGFDSSSTIQISISGSYSGNEQKIFSTNCSANMTKGTFTISGKTEKVSWPGTIVGSTPIKGWVNVRFEYYKDQGIMQVYYDGEYRGESDLVWNEANKLASFSHATFYTVKDSNCEFYLDNIVAESIKKDYVKGTAPAAGTPAGSEKDEIGQGGSSGGSTGSDTSDDDDTTGDVPVITEPYTGFTDFESHQTGTFAIPGINLSKLSSTSAYAMVMEDPRDAAGKVLNFYAKGWKNKLNVQILENEEQTVDKISVSWDMNFTSINSKSTYQIFFGTDGDLPTYAMEMTVATSGAITLKDISTTNGSATHRKSTLIADLSAGWHNLRLDYVIDSSTCIANIWIDGYYITTSNNFYNYAGHLSAPKAIHDSIIISATSNVDAIMQLDNISANYVTSVETPPVYEGELNFEDEELGETKMLGFASALTGDGYAKVVSDPRDAAKKVLEHYSKGTGNYVQSVIYGGESENTDKAHIGWDMYFPSVNAGSTYQISLGFDGSDRTFMIQVTAKTDGTYSVSAIASTNWKVAKTVTIASGLSADWHRIEVEMQIVDGEFLAVAYVDGDFAATCYNFYNYSGSETATPRAMGKYVRFSSTSNVDATMMLDNIVAKFVDEIKEPPVYEGVLDFEYYEEEKTRILGMSTSFESSAAYAKVAKDPRNEAQKVLEFYAKGAKNVIQSDIYAAESGNTTKARFSWDMNFTSVTASSTYQLGLGYDGEFPTYMLQLTAATSGKVTLKDISSTNGSVQKSTAMVSGLAAGWHNICVEMEIVDGVFNANVYVDDEFVVTSHNFYNYSGSETATPRAIGKYFRFNSTGGTDATVLIDNVTAKYVDEITEPPVFEGTNDFEYYDEGKSFVLGTTHTLSNGTLSVQKDTTNETNKALKFYTNGTGNSVKFDMYGEKTDSCVVEFDIMFTDVSASSAYQLSIGGSYTLQITADTKGTWTMIDRNDVTTWSAEHYKSMSFTGDNPLTASQWHKIRVEYSINETACEAKVYIDGTLAGTSDHFYNGGGTATAPAAIGNYVNFKSTGGCNATVWFDNVTTKYVE